MTLKCRIADMAKLEEQVRSVKKDGLLWGACAPLPLRLTFSRMLLAMLPNCFAAMSEE